jgi:GTP-binding protein
LTLELAVEFIDDDELIEITPQSIRVRKRHLTDHERRRAARSGGLGAADRAAQPVT